MVKVSTLAMPHGQILGHPVLDIADQAVQGFEVVPKLLRHVIERRTGAKLIGFVGVVVRRSEEIIRIISTHGNSKRAMLRGSRS